MDEIDELIKQVKVLEEKVEGNEYVITYEMPQGLTKFVERLWGKKWEKELNKYFVKWLEEIVVLHKLDPDTCRKYLKNIKSELEGDLKL